MNLSSYQIQPIEVIVDDEIIKSNLSKFQKWICKVFDIIPASKYYYTITIIFNEPQPMRMGDILLSADNVQWFVSKTFDKSATLKILSGLSYPLQRGTLANPLYIIGRSIGERTMQVT